MNIQDDYNVLIISFDGVPMSGIVVESIKLAGFLKNSKKRIFMDLGYDIKIDKGNFNKEYKDECSLFGELLELVRVANIFDIPDYNINFLTNVFDAMIRNNKVVEESELRNLKERVDEVSDTLSDSILAFWLKNRIGYLIVENGTIPENIVYTKALYKAIDKYGQQLDLDKFVLWRDHDLMWNSETSAGKYGSPPYEFAIKPVDSPYIKYFTLNQTSKVHLLEWCGYDLDINVLPNSYDFERLASRKNIRHRFGIRKNDVVISRITRIIPQKRLDRDIILIKELNRLFSQDDIKIYLLVAGNTNEDVCHYHQLREMVKNYDVEDYVIFVGSLCHDFYHNTSEFTVEDLIHSADLISFLTSYDYDSYGNPIGEAICQSKCYITTSYEYYDEVYGNKGFLSPVMNISKENDGVPDKAFINEVYALLKDPVNMKRYAEHNYKLGRELLSHRILDDIFFSDKR
ncbi:glycosyltransferase [Xenorhabdus sp. PB30.3]|uniref:glycosyltransferase n=1 Tax=Xenorhabdus sp. PB30.3 TaxID=2788941 RepID=UPI001E5B1CF7|nr:glycosyltransferase [Xenorhabdus sp. PB30.3]